MYKKRLHLLTAALVTCCCALAQGWPSGYGGVMLQGFSWDSYSDTQWTNLESMAYDLDGSFDLLWIPNAGNCGDGNQMGYSPKYWFPVGSNYNSSFGTLAQLRSMISAMGLHGIGIIGDVVINHRQNVSNWTDFPSETYNGVTYRLTASDICSDDDGGATANHLQSGEHLGNADTGDDWSGMRDLDHTSNNVQNNVKALLNMLLNDLGYVGFRYDMVAGYSPTYTSIYNTYSNPQFSVGECWKTGSEIKTWIDGTKNNGTPTSAAFDFQFRYTVRNAINNNDWTKLSQANTGSGGYPLVSNNFESGSYKQWAVTFVENHDTQDRGNTSGYSKDPINSDTLAANAYMLSMPGTPCVFMPHLKAYKKEIKNMIAARKAAGVTNTSSYSVSSSQATRFLTSTTGSKTRLICAVGTGANNYGGPNNSIEILKGHNYKYFMPNSANIAWVDVPSGTYSEAFDVKLTAVSANYTTLVYTTDGSTPSGSNGTRVSSGTSIRISGDATLTVALLNGNNIVNGSTATRKYKMIATKKFTVYLKDPGWTNVYFKIFQTSDGNDDSGTYGVNVNANTTMVHGEKFYYRTFESTDLNYHFNMLFCDGSWGNDHQTSNINNVNSDVYYEITGGGGNSRLTVTDVTSQYTGAYTVTVYFSASNWDNVNYYAWDDNGEKLGNWPGQQVSQTTIVDGITYHYLDFEIANEEAFNVVFNNGNGTQTVDVTGIDSDVYYILDDATDNQGHHYVLTPGQKSVTVHFKDPRSVVSDWTNVSFYAWNNSGNPLGSWPGTQVTDQKTVGGDNYYYYRFVLDENSSINVIFNNASSGGSSTKQTTDIVGVTHDIYYQLTGATSNGKYIWEEVTPGPEFITLAALLTNGINGTAYAISDDLAVVERAEGQPYAFVTDGHDNWLKVDFPTEMSNSFGTESIIKAGTLKGTFNSGLNPSLTVSTAPEAGSATVDYNVTEVDLQTAVSFKPNQVVNIIGFISGNKMYGMKDFQTHQFSGYSIDLNTSWANSITFDPDKQYQLPFAITLNAINGGIRMKDATPLTGYTANVLSTSGNIVTAIDNIISVGSVKRIHYYNALGSESAVPFKGINIVVTEMSDGSITVVKVMK